MMQTPIKLFNDLLFPAGDGSLENLTEELLLCDGYQMCRQMISEGLIRSYPEDAVCRRMLSTYGVRAKNIEFTSANKHDNDLPIIGMAIDARGNPQILTGFTKRDLGMLGWHICRPVEYYAFDFGTQESKEDEFSEYNMCKDPGRHHAYVFWLAPNSPISNERVSSFTKEILSKYPKFYHVSLDRLRARINLAKNTGLIPQESEFGDFLYPPRNYLFSSEDAAARWVEDLLTTELGTTKLRNLRVVGNDVQRNNGNRTRAAPADDKFQSKNAWPLAVYEVDLRKLVDDGHPLRLYRDNNWADQPDAFFTMDHIPGEYLRDITDEFKGNTAK